MPIQNKYYISDISGNIQKYRYITNENDCYQFYDIKNDVIINVKDISVFYDIDDIQSWPPEITSRYNEFLINNINESLSNINNKSKKITSLYQNIDTSILSILEKFNNEFSHNISTMKDIFNDLSEHE